MHDVKILPQNTRSSDTNQTLDYGHIDTPFGLGLIASIGDRLCELSFEQDPELALERLKKRFPLSMREDSQKAKEGWDHVWQQFKNGKGTLKLLLKGTPFQCAVWQALLGIERGKTLSYQDIAIQVNSPKAMRAVGQAVGANPLAILVPCHRVIQKNGKLGGFAYGIAFKQRLLELERAPLS